MTLTISLPPEVEIRLQEEATKNGQEPQQYILLALKQALGLSDQEKAETELLADWKSASHRSLQEVWDNEEDAVYDNL